MKSRVLLYAASPLYLDWQNLDESYLPSDLKKWEKAAKAARDVIDLNEYTLYGDYAGLFANNISNREFIFQKRYTNSIAFVAGYKSYFNISAIYSHTSNLVSQIPNFDAVTGDKTFYWGNYGSQTVAGGVLSIMEYPLVKNLFYFSLNSLFASLENCTAENIEDLYEKESSFFMTHYFTLTTLLPRNWKVEFVGYYMNGARSGGMKVDNICNFYAGVKKELMEKRLTLSLSMNDLFNTFKMNIETITPTNRYILNQHQFQQRISFGIKYNFGKVQSGRKNNKRDNTSQRVGNSSGGGISASGMGGM